MIKAIPRQYILSFSKGGYFEFATGQFYRENSKSDTWLDPFDRYLNVSLMNIVMCVHVSTLST